MIDALGERMKEQYEDRTRYFVPRRTYTIIRLDGKSFHTYTRGLKKPCDNGLDTLHSFDGVARWLCQSCPFRRTSQSHHDVVGILRLWILPCKIPKMI